MHFRICCATILVIFCPLKRFCKAWTYNVLHTINCARVDSQINFSVVVHGRMQDLPMGANYFFWGGGVLATRGVAMHLLGGFGAGLGSSTVDQVLKYTKYPKYIPSTSTGQVLIFLKKVLKYIKYFHIKYKYKYSY